MEVHDPDLENFKVADAQEESMLSIHTQIVSSVHEESANKTDDNLGLNMISDSKKHHKNVSGNKLDSMQKDNISEETAVYNIIKTNTNKGMDAITVSINHDRDVPENKSDIIQKANDDQAICSVTDILENENLS